MTEDEKKLVQSGFQHVHIIGSVLNYRRSLAMAMIKLLSNPRFAAIDPAEHGLPDQNYLWSEVDLLMVDLSEHKSDIRPWFFEMSQTGLLPPVIFIDNNEVQLNDLPISETDETGNTYQARQLCDGSTHRVLKNFPSEVELKALLEPIAKNVVYKNLDNFWILEYEVCK